MRRLSVSLLVALALSPAYAASAGLAVVVNPENPVGQLTRAQVVDLYMGRETRFPNGRTVLPIDLPPDSPIRATYYQRLVDKTVPQVNAYWARLLFTGRATPPRVLPDPESILQTISENKDAIGYLDASEVDARVRVVLELN